MPNELTDRLHALLFSVGERMNSKDRVALHSEIVFLSIELRELRACKKSWEELRKIVAVTVSHPKAKEVFSPELLREMQDLSK